MFADGLFQLFKAVKGGRILTFYLQTSIEDTVDLLFVFFDLLLLGPGLAEHFGHLVAFERGQLRFTSD